MKKLILQEIKYEKKNNYCCELMSQFVEDPRIGVDYFNTYREYYLDTTNANLKQTILYCPFCSSKLPKGLSEQYFSALEKEYNIDDPHDLEQEKLIPEEFKSDEWWQKRNL